MGVIYVKWKQRQCQVQGLRLPRKHGTHSDYTYKSSGSPWETEKNFKFEYASKQVVQVIFLAQYFKKSGFTKNIYATIMK